MHLGTATTALTAGILLAAAAPAHAAVGVTRPFAASYETASVTGTYTVTTSFSIFKHLRIAGTLTATAGCYSVQLSQNRPDAEVREIARQCDGATPVSATDDELIRDPGWLIRVCRSDVQCGAWTTLS
jgi:hypothetical protein